MDNTHNAIFADLYWARFQTVRFYKHFKKEFCKRLPIPEYYSFVAQQSFPSTVTVTHPGMLSWKFDIVKSSNVLYFAGEWEGFVKDHQLEEGDLITFEYTKDQDIRTIVFKGDTECEKESAYFIDSRSSTGVYTGKRKRPSSSQFNSHPTYSQANDNAHEKSNIAPIIAKSPKTASPLHGTTNAHKESTHNMIIVMSKAYVSSGFTLTLKSQWARTHMPKKSQHIFLRTNDKEWKVNYLIQEKCFVFAGGWKQFVIQNGIQVGDICEFQVADQNPKKFAMDVHIPSNDKS